MEQRKKKRRRRSSWDLDRDKVAESERRLRESRREVRDPEHLLRLLEAGETVKVPIRSELHLTILAFESFREATATHSCPPPDGEALRQLLRFCGRHTDLLGCRQASQYASALVALSAYRREWLRPLEDWRATSHNAERQFRSLLRHLIAAYEVPQFLDAAWFEGLSPRGLRYQGWYRHVARGKNIRKADDLPLPLTKAQAHFYLQSPSDFDILGAFRRAIVIDMGGDERLARAILPTKVGTTFENEEFWGSVFRFFIANPRLDTQHYGPIIDFLDHQRYVPSVPNPRAGEPGQAALVPPHPNLSMKGRTVESLLRAVRDWHRELARARDAVVASWDVSGLPGFVLEEGTGEDNRRFEIAELVTGEALAEEGKAMNHCVASYRHLCASGKSSIWSLRMTLESGRVVRLATIEVRNKDATIIQVRRRLNRPPTERERAILKRWEEAGGPKLAYFFPI